MSRTNRNVFVRSALIPFQVVLLAHQYFYSIAQALCEHSRTTILIFLVFCISLETVFRGGEVSIWYSFLEARKIILWKQPICSAMWYMWARLFQYLPLQSSTRAERWFRRSDNTRCECRLANQFGPFEFKWIRVFSRCAYRSYCGYQAFARPLWHSLHRCETMCRKEVDGKGNPETLLWNFIDSFCEKNCSPLINVCSH